MNLNRRRVRRSIVSRAGILAGMRRRLGSGLLPTSESIDEGGGKGESRDTGAFSSAACLRHKLSGPSVTALCCLAYFSFPFRSVCGTCFAGRGDRSNRPVVVSSGNRKSVRRAFWRVGQGCRLHTLAFPYASRGLRNVAARLRVSVSPPR